MKRSRFLLTQVILWVFVSLFIAVAPLYAATAPSLPQQVQAIQSLEDALFSVRYDQDSIENRLSRLEQTIFGQSQKGLSTDARLAKLKQVLSPASLGPLSPTGKPNDPVNSNASEGTTPQKVTASGKSGLNGSNPAPRKENPTPIASDATDYPTVTQMEQKVIGKTFTNEDITQRLARLEKQVFKNTQSGSLADRVDNLRLVVLGDVAPSAPSPVMGSYGMSSYGSAGNPQFPMSPSYNGDPSAQSYNTPGNSPPIAASNDIIDPMGGNGSSAQNSTGPTPDMLSATAEIEKQVLGQQYPSDPFNARLDRLENKIFHTTSPEMSQEDRIQRILAVASAGGTPPTTKTRVKHGLLLLLPIILTILPILL